MPNNHRRFLKIRKEGGSRVMVVTNLLPPDWKMVRAEVERYYEAGAKKWCIIRVEKVV